MDFACIGDRGSAADPAPGSVGLWRLGHRAMLVAGRIASALLTGALSGLALAEIDDAEVRACRERAFPEKSMAQMVTIRVLDRIGTVSESAANLYWKRFDDGHARALIRFTDPPHRARVALLLIESDYPDPKMYLYLPELRQSRRVTGKAFAGPMFGTDFSYEDFSYFQGIATVNDLRRTEDRQVDERPAYVLEKIPVEEDSAYARIVTYIDHELCLPAKTEFFAHDGSLRKRLTVVRDDIHKIGNRWIPHKLIMYDLAEQSRTEVLVRQAEIDSELPDILFTDADLQRER
jgi:hypothetical protein